MISSEVRGAVTVIALDRHERRNALDVDHCIALRGAVDTAVGQDARALVITGTGTSFCAGADLHGVYGDSFRTALYGALTSIARAPVPVIAAVNGPAIGAGTQLAISCDLRVAAESAVFAVPTARNGLAVDPWTIRRLASLAGGGPARAMLLGAESVDVALASRCGLVDRVGSLSDALSWAAEIATFAPMSLSYSKRVLESMTQGHGSDRELEAEFDACWSSEDVAEGQRARREARTPQFVGR